MTLELWQIKIRTASACKELLGVVENVEREVEDAARDGSAIDGHVLLGKVPAARAHEQRRDLFVELVFLAFRADVVDAPADRVAQIDLPLDVVVPGRRIRVLEVRHEYLGPRIERVDDHLAIDGTGDFDAPILDVVGDGGAGPGSFAEGPRFGKEIGQVACIKISLPCSTPGQEFGAPPTEGPLQLRGKGQRIGREDLSVLGADGGGNLYPGRVVRHGRKGSGSHDLSLRGTWGR